MTDFYRPPETHDPRPPRRPVPTSMWVIVIGGGAMLMLTYCGMILVPLSIPLILHDQEQSRQVEARLQLAEIASAQGRHQAQHGQFATTFAALQWRPPEEHQYSYFLGEDSIQAGDGPFELPHTVATPAIPTEGYVVHAVGNIDGDTDLDVWRVNAGGELFNVLDDADLGW